MANGLAAIRGAAVPVNGARSDYDALIEAMGDGTRFVLIGEASHGTQEFYHERARITRRLIEEKAFRAVAVEADWPDAYRVNQYVRGASDDRTPEEALSGFKRFPAWMWRNTEVVEFIEWLREYNDALPRGAPRCGFYGLDLYSLFTSIEAVVNYLDRVDPEAARRARYRYGCFEHFGEDSQAYGYSASFDLSESCENEVITQLLEIQRRAAEYARRDGRIPYDEHFYAEQNARLVRNAERYYRTMFLGRVSSWNLRDRHMAETLDALDAHFASQNQPRRFAVWERNSHLGDARATELGRGGELNVGQLVRESHPGESRLIAFTTYAGTVTAASDWGGDAERKRVRPGLPGSYEELFHNTAIPRFLLLLSKPSGVVDELRRERLERAIGVIYRPESERLSHYFHARLADQFDAAIHLDTTRALQPLERASVWEKGEMETMPFGV